MIGIERRVDELSSELLEVFHQAQNVRRRGGVVYPADIPGAVEEVGFFGVGDI